MSDRDKREAYAMQVAASLAGAEYAECVIDRGSAETIAVASWNIVDAVIAEGRKRNPAPANHPEIPDSSTPVTETPSDIHSIAKLGAHYKTIMGVWKVVQHLYDMRGVDGERVVVPVVVVLLVDGELVDDTDSGVCIEDAGSWHECEYEPCDAPKVENRWRESVTPVPSLEPDMLCPAPSTHPPVVTTNEDARRTVLGVPTPAHVAVEYAVANELGRAVSRWASSYAPGTWNGGNPDHMGGSDPSDALYNAAVRACRDGLIPHYADDKGTSFSSLEHAPPADAPSILDVPPVLTTHADRNALAEAICEAAKAAGVDRLCLTKSQDVAIDNVAIDDPALIDVVGSLQLFLWIESTRILCCPEGNPSITVATGREAVNWLVEQVKGVQP